MARILVVDGNRMVGRLCQVNLERAGHTVTVLQSGRDAAELLQTLSFDLVLSDLILSVGDGPGLYAQMRRDLRTREVPFVLFGVRYNHHTDDKAYAWNVRLLTRDALLQGVFSCKPVQSAGHGAPGKPAPGR